MVAQRSWARRWSSSARTQIRAIRRTVKDCFAESADGRLTGQVDAQPASDTLPSTLTGHADVDNLPRRSFAGHVHPGLAGRDEYGFLERQPGRPLELWIKFHPPILGTQRLSGPIWPSSKDRFSTLDDQRRSGLGNEVRRRAD
jgi:hypothetical protein